jgi:hypothetical protein
MAIAITLPTQHQARTGQYPDNAGVPVSSSLHLLNELFRSRASHFSQEPLP